MLLLFFFFSQTQLREVTKCSNLAYEVKGRYLALLVRRIHIVKRGTGVTGAGRGVARARVLAVGSDLLEAGFDLASNKSLLGVGACVCVAPCLVLVISVSRFTI